MIILYINIHACVYLYIQNNYTQYTHTYMQTQTFILDAINRD